MGYQMTYFENLNLSVINIEIKKLIEIITRLDFMHMFSKST